MCNGEKNDESYPEQILEPLELCEFKIGSDAARILEEFRKIIVDTNKFGITVNGPYVTFRFGERKRDVEVSMLVQSITDSTILEPYDPDYGK